MRNGFDILYPKERRLTETMSETSETTSTTTATSVSGRLSFDNVEELRELANLLHVDDPDKLEQERVRVDRRKLEQMLLGEYVIDSADAFFQKVMEETNTFITWPTRLKIGAKSKKDPHIKVVGLSEAINMAKDQIIQVLDTRNSRVTMKLDVSYTDHSHIIGKGGLTIKKVMEETNCHIHFPDSNRSNHQEKSNQVSIAGDMDGVEKARARVRELTPLIFSFELPVMGNNLQLAASSSVSPFANSPYIAKIQEMYNVQVMFRTRPKLHATLVVVKGCEWEPQQAKEATVRLMHHMCENLASQIHVQMTMEISPQHHSIVLGKQSNNLKSIMQRTGTQIMFPDAGDPNIPSLKKNNVTIVGSINSVYSARQQLMGSLPLVLMFDIPEKSTNSVTTDDVSRLMQSLDVFINVRHKPKQSTLSIIIKGIERNASNMYEARRQLLNLDDPKVIAKIPESYHVPNAPSLFSLNLGSSNSPFVINESINGKSGDSRTVSPSFSSTSSGFHSLGSNSSMNSSPSMSFSQQCNLGPVLPPLFPACFTNQLTPNYAYINNLLSLQQQQQQALQNVTQAFGSMEVSSPMYRLNSSFNGNIFDNIQSSLFSNDKTGSGLSSVGSVSSSLSSPTVSPRNLSPVDVCAETNTNFDMSNVFAESTLPGNLQGTSNEKKTTQLEMQSNLQDLNSMTFDLEQKKLMARKAMQTKPSANNFRVPTNVWSGYGLSQSIPPENAFGQQTTSLWKDLPSSTSQDFPEVSKKNDNSHEKITGLTASNYLENTPNLQLNKITSQRYTNLPMMLTSVGLEKYIHLFTENEIDMTTFPILTDKDLEEIGITAWGAKRKIMLLIAELKNRTSSFSGSAAPGAERKFASLSSSASMSPTSSIRNSSLESNGW